MPSSWKRSPEELHKTYIANTEAFYKVAGRGLAGELDSFVSDCALQLWGRCGGITQEHVDAINQLYSKGAVMPKWLLWELTEKVCAGGDFLPPLFFWTLAEEDRQKLAEEYSHGEKANADRVSVIKNRWLPRLLMHAKCVVREDEEGTLKLSPNRIAFLKPYIKWL